MTYTIAEPCIDVKDKACVEECPVDCIYEGDRMLYIQPDECVDCGACEPACPVEAIFYEDDVPDEWKEFTPVNAEFFNDDVTGLGLARRRGQGRPRRQGPPEGRRLALKRACRTPLSLQRDPPPSSRRRRRTLGAARSPAGRPRPGRRPRRTAVRVDVVEHPTSDD